MNTADPNLHTLSVVIPARNEAGAIADTVTDLHDVLTRHAVAHEIVVVDDHSTDGTWAALCDLRGRVPTLMAVRNRGTGGFGAAVRQGLAVMTGDAVVIMMADASDDSHDVIRYWQALGEGYECVFGSRFMRGGQAADYPLPKLVLNRLANRLIQVLFGIGLNDTTNAFKAYRRNVIEGCAPLLAVHFNLTVELPLKAIVRGYRWTVVPVRWRNRKTGIAKFRIREMGSRYFFIIMTVWLEKSFSRGDYRRRPPGAPLPPDG